MHTVITRNGLLTTVFLALFTVAIAASYDRWFCSYCSMDMTALDELSGPITFIRSTVNSVVNQWRPGDTVTITNGHSGLHSVTAALPPNSGFRSTLAMAKVRAHSETLKMPRRQVVAAEEVAAERVGLFSPASAAVLYPQARWTWALFSLWVAVVPALAATSDNRPLQSQRKSPSPLCTTPAPRRLHSGDICQAYAWAPGNSRCSGRISA